jgi:hypothetical protein
MEWESKYEFITRQGHLLVECSDGSLFVLCDDEVKGIQLVQLHPPIRASLVPLVPLKPPARRSG